MRVTRRGALAALLPVVLAGGCAVGSTRSSADDARALAEPLGQATSAVETARVAARLLDAGDAPPAVVDAALLDQVRVLQDAADTVATLVPAPGPGAGWQADALDVVRDAQQAVVATRAWATGGDGTAAQVHAVLDAAADDVDALSGTLEQAGAA